MPVVAQQGAGQRATRVLARWACGLWMLSGAAAFAHPHAAADCRVDLHIDRLGLQAVALQLTLDSAASAQWLPRLQLDPQEPGSRDARQGLLQQQLLAGLLRHSGWLLDLRSAGAAEAPVRWADAKPATLHQDSDGRVVVRVELTPSAEGPAPKSLEWQVRCHDPHAYWLAAFEPNRSPGTAGLPCRVAMGPMQDVSVIAQALQAAARKAGIPGADRMAPELARGGGPQRATTARVQCDSA